MARSTSTNFVGALDFTTATAATDLFKKEDVQVLAQAVDLHDHTTTKGLPVAQLAASVTIPGGGMTISGGPVTIGTLSVTSVTSSGAVHVTTSLTVDGPATFNQSVAIGTTLDVGGAIAGASTLLITAASRLQGPVAIGPQAAPATALSVQGPSPNVPANTVGIGYSLAATAGAQTALRGPLKGAGASGPVTPDAVNWWIINLGGNNVYVPYFI